MTQIEKDQIRFWDVHEMDPRFVTPVNPLFQQKNVTVIRCKTCGTVGGVLTKGECESCYHPKWVPKRRVSKNG